MKRYLFLFVIVLFFASAPHAFAAGCAGTGNCYWVGGTGNASSVTNWATTDGGLTTGSIPTATDNCNFTANSSTANAAYTWTIDATTNCKDFVMAGPGGGNKVTWAGSAALNTAGNLNLSGGTTGITLTYTGILSFTATSGTKTITSNSVPFLGNITFNGSGGTFQLVDQLTQGGNKNLTLTAGSFNPNSQAVVFSNAGAATNIVGAFSFYDLTITGSSLNTTAIIFTANVTITHNLTINGANSTTGRILVTSDSLGNQTNPAPRTLTAANVSVSNADFSDITGAGAGSWDLRAITGNSGDCGGNSGITFTTSSDQHWVAAAGAGGSWSNASNWTSRVPLPQDNVFFDFAFGTAQTVTADMLRIGKSISFTGATWTTSLTLTTSIANSTFYGSLTLVANMTISGFRPIPASRTSSTLTSAGNTFSATGFNILAPGGTYTLQDNFTHTNTNGLQLLLGTLNTNGVYVKVTRFISTSGGTRALILGGSTFELTTTSGANIWSVSAALSLTANTSTIKITDTTATNITFVGAGLIYNNVWWSRGASAASNTFSGSNTFSNIKDDGNVAHSLLFTNATTQTVSSFSVSGSSGNVITLNSITTATAAIKTVGLGQICSDFLNIQHIVATPSTGVWYAGTHSVNNQATATAGSGWNFTPCFHTKIAGGKITIHGGQTIFK